MLSYYSEELDLQLLVGYSCFFLNTKRSLACLQHNQIDTSLTSQQTPSSGVFQAQMCVEPPRYQSLEWG